MLTMQETDFFLLKPLNKFKTIYRVEREIRMKLDSLKINDRIPVCGDLIEKEIIIVSKLT